MRSLQSAVWVAGSLWTQEDRRLLSRRLAVAMVVVVAVAVAVAVAEPSRVVCDGNEDDDGVTTRAYSVICCASSFGRGPNEMG